MDYNTTRIFVTNFYENLDLFNHSHFKEEKIFDESVYVRS